MVTKSEGGALAPFRHKVFAVLWLAALISNIGTWMHAVGAGWLMTQISPSPLVVALVQSATSLPVFLFALPAGALADLYNRKTLLVITNIAMLFAAGLFAWLAAMDAIGPVLLLIFTVIFGAGAAFTAPAWQAVIPAMVPKSDLPQAVALGGISINISRAIGPAMAGFLITLYGFAAPFWANMLSFVVILIALVWWQYEKPEDKRHLKRESLWWAMKGGIGYARHSLALKETMLHVLVFMFFGNAFWGLLPLLAEGIAPGDPGFFGLLMAAVGSGAVSGALLLPRIKKKASANQLVGIGTIGTAAITAAFAIQSIPVLSYAAGYIFGLSWIFVLATINVSAQQALPEWVRARGLALFLMVFYGSMTLGSAFWGWLAGVYGISFSLLVASVGAVIAFGLVHKVKLQRGKDLNLAISAHWPNPVLHPDHGDGEQDRGPVMIQIRYEIANADRTAFLEAMQAMKDMRLRNGAFDWMVYEDAEQAGIFVESFKELSWHQHLRHHDHITHEDKPLQEAVQQFHKGEGKPKAVHLLASH